MTAVRELARKTSATLFSTLLTAFQVALSHWTGAKDILVGTPVANRTKQAARETMGYFAGVVPLRGQVDAVAIFTATSYMNLVALKLDPDKDFRWISYADAGLDLYSNGVMVSPKFDREKPDAVKGLVRAINRALKECVASPDAAIAEVWMRRRRVVRMVEGFRSGWSRPTH